jgi:hypothetical protein
VLLLQETIQAFKEHISSFVDEPVLLEWPIDEEKAVHVFIYSVFDEIGHRPNNDHLMVIRALVFTNPEYEYGSLGRVMQGLRQHPIIQTKDSRSQVVLIPITTDEVAQIFVARNQPFRLSVAYEIRS